MEGVRIHDMKRTFVSGLVAANANQAIATTLAGHKSPTTTLPYCVSVADEARRKEAGRLQRLGVDLRADSQKQSG